MNQKYRIETPRCPNQAGKLMTCGLVLSIILLMPLMVAHATDIDQNWVRVHQPHQSLRQDLPAQAIDYGAFIWMPESSLQPDSIGNHGRVERRQQPFAYHLDGERVDPQAGFPQSDWTAARQSTSADFHLVQFAGPVRGEWLQKLRQRGITPVQAMHPFSFIVWSTPEAMAETDNISEIRWSGDFLSAFRVPADQRQLDSDDIPSMALIHRPTKDSVSTAMRQAGAVIHSTTALTTHLSIVHLTAPGDRYLTLSRLPGLFTLQKISDGAGPRSETSQQSIVGNYDNSNVIFPGYLDWLTPTGLSGDGVTVGIVDGGIFDSHPDLVDNMVACTGPGASCSNSTNSHGTHVAGAVAGTAASGVTDGAGFLRGQGVAPGASLVEQRYNPLLGGGPGSMIPEGMLIIYRDSAISGAQLTNNSWGPTGTPQGYDIPTMEIDFITRDADPQAAGDQPVLAVWSIMNGNGDRNFGSCAPSSLGSPDEAKNLFAVGSTRLYSGGTPTTNIFDISSNSAHGPACDGRLVPHIVAPGCSTDAPDSATGYGFKCGTSMASPVISGSVALFWERYRNEQGTDPSPALVKAVFSAIAMNLEGMNDADGNTVQQRPNRTQGWGRVDLDAVINPPNAVWMVDQQDVFTGSGQQFDVTLTPENAADPVRMMLVWTDAPGPGTGGTNPAWVNDLDLTASTGGTAYLGNDFASDGFAATGGSADSINNMEAVFLRADQHNGNAIDISVIASNVTGDALNPYDPMTPTQDFALVCYNCVAADNGSIFTDGFED